jgi:aryl-alcohol dehydrogenase
MREITAATIRRKGGLFQVEKLFLGDPRPDEVLVRVVATGMCHTDMVARDQLYDVPLPVVLGHEGAGVVEEVGSSVKKVKAGDHVVLTYMWCGHCKPCLRGDLTYCENFYPLNFGGAREDGSTATCEAGGGPFTTISSGSCLSGPLRWCISVTPSGCRAMPRSSCWVH